MKSEQLLIKASQQALSESLGFDEAQVYYILLTKNESQIEKEFSYSKRYRVMKSLFEQGAVGKYKQKEKDFFSYFLLPPSFLALQNFETEIVCYLEKIYMDNYSDFLKAGIGQIVLRDERPILIFLLKYFMRDSAKVMAGNLDLKKMLGDKSRKIDMINRDEDIKRSSIIDKKLAYELVKIPALKDREYIGYISTAAINATIVH